MKTLYGKTRTLTNKQQWRIEKIQGDDSARRT